jgi:hypothetical protein
MVSPKLQLLIYKRKFLKVLIVIFLSFHSLLSVAEDYKYYTGYSFLNQNFSTSNPPASDLVNSNDSGLSITSGRVVESINHFEFEFSYLGDMGFTYADYLTYHRYITLIGLNFIRTWDYVSFGTGFGIMRIDNHISESSEAGVSITEELRSGVGYYNYFKLQLELHYAINRFELFTNFINYYWFQDDGDISVDDNGQLHKKSLSLLQSVRTLNFGLRYYFN